MFQLRVFPTSPNGVKWQGDFPSVERAVEVATKENGTKMSWTYREVTNSHKAHGRRATYFIDELPNSASVNS